MRSTNVIDGTARIHSSVELGCFNVIKAGVVIGPGTIIGDHCVFGPDTLIGANCKFTAYDEIRNGCVIGDGTRMGSRVTLPCNIIVGKNVVIRYGFCIGNVPDLSSPEEIYGTIGDGALIGANVFVMPGVHIGAGALIGVCSQVRRNVPPNEVWFGNPAKFYRDR